MAVLAWQREQAVIDLTVRDKGAIRRNHRKRRIDPVSLL